MATYTLLASRLKKNYHGDVGIRKLLHERELNFFHIKKFDKLLLDIRMGSRPYFFMAQIKFTDEV